MLKQSLIVGPAILALCLYASSHYGIKFNFLPLPVFALLGTIFVSAVEAKQLAKAAHDKATHATKP